MRKSPAWVMWTSMRRASVTPASLALSCAPRAQGVARASVKIGACAAVPHAHRSPFQAPDVPRCFSLRRGTEQKSSQSCEPMLPGKAVLAVAQCPVQ